MIFFVFRVSAIFFFQKKKSADARGFSHVVSFETSLSINRHLILYLIYFSTDLIRIFCLDQSPDLIAAFVSYSCKSNGKKYQSASVSTHAGKYLIVDLIVVLLR